MNSLLLAQFGGDGVEARRKAATATIEESVDPFYAEYRRKRRQRRGSLSGAADEDPLQTVPMSNVIDMFNGPNGPGSANGSMERQAHLLSRGSQGSQMSQGLGGGGGAALFSPGSTMMGGGGGGGGMGSGNGVVILLDSPNSEFGSFYGEKLETEFNMRVIFAANAADLQSNMLSQGNAVVGVLFAETTMDPETVASMRASWRKPLIAYGVRTLQASGLPADDYLRVPQMGVPYDHSVLGTIVAKHLSGGGGGMGGGMAASPMGGMGAAASASPFGNGGGNRWQSAAAAIGDPAPKPGKANIDKLLADIAKLKTTINQQGAGGSRSGSP